MRRFILLIAFATTAAAQQPFTLQQILSAPYATSLTASPVGARFAWVENAEGVRNIWIGGPKEPARQLTHYTEDDGQDVSSLTWSPDGSIIAYVYGAETGASGKPANAAHLQRPTPIDIILQPTTGGDPIHVGEGRSPLFTHDGNSLLFVRYGQIFITDLAALKICVVNKNCHPERSLVAPSRDAAEEPVLSLSKEPAAVPAPPQSPAPFNHVLLFDRGSASSLTLSPDGKLLAYISHRRTHSFLALYNLETKTLTFPAPSTGNDAAPIFSPDGKHLAWLRFPFTDAPEFATNRTSPNPWSIQLLDLTNNTTRTLFTPEANKPGSVLPRMSTGEPHLYWIAPSAPTTELSSRPEVERPAVSSSGNIVFFSEADGWVHLYSIDSLAPNANAVLLTPGNYEVEDATFDTGNEFVLFSANGVGLGACGYDDPPCNDPLDSDRRHVWELSLNKGVVELGAIGVTSGSAIETHPTSSIDGSVLAALISDAHTPMHPVIVSSNRKITPLHPGANPITYPAAQFVTPKQVLFPSSGSFTIHAQLFLPPHPDPIHKHPAILFFHGGPKRQMLLGYPAMDYYSNAYAMNQYLASRGYIVLSVNYRGGIGYGLDFRQCEHCGADGAAEYADVLAAAAYLRSRPDVDTAHIGIWGGSYGGYLTALALARNSDIFAAGVDFHGVHEWAREDNATADWLRGSLAEQEKIAALAHSSSPMADVAKWKSPVLLIHGDDDPEVAYTQTPMLADALRARNVHVEELIFPDELHGFLLHKDWLAAYQAASDFFDRTLKPTH